MAKSEKIALPAPLLTKTQAARYLGVTDECVTQWLKSNRFPPADIVLPSGRKRWRQETIDAFLADCRPEGDTE